MKLRIGTRGSELALWQSHRIQFLLKNILNIESDLLIIKTQGDQIQNVPLSQLDGKGFFTKELEDALLENKIDLAVHSLKDLPTTLPSGLKIGAIPERVNSQDRLIIRKGFFDNTKPFFLKSASAVGTSSNRRIDQVKILQPDLKIENLRGNVPTRVQKLRDGKYDAIILASAGTDRLGLDLSEFDTIDLDQNLFVSAPGQGALAIEIRKNDPAVESIISQLHSSSIEKGVGEERRFLQLTEGGCHASVGSHFFKHQNRFYLTTFWNTGENYYKLSVGNNSAEKLAEKSFLLHQKLQNKSNETVWIVRDNDKAGDLNYILLKSGRTVISESVIETKSSWTFESVQKVTEKIKNSDWIFFTSSNAVHHFFEQKIDLPTVLSVACIGMATESALKEYGIKTSFISTEGTGESLANDFLKQFSGSKGTILYPTTSSADNNIQAIIEKSAWKLERINIYETIEKEINTNLFDGKKIDKVVVYSSSAVKPIIQLLEKLNQNPKWISIGPKTSETILFSGKSVFSEAEFPETGDILEAIIN